MLNIFQYRNGLRLIPATSLVLNQMGELQVYQTDGKIYYHNGVIASPLVTESGSSTAIITSKSFIDNSTLIISHIDGTISLGFAIGGTTGTETTLATSQTVNRTITLPDATDTLVGKNTTDTLTNKTIDGGNNTITGISNASFAPMAAHTFKGNNTGSPSVPLDLTATQLTAELNVFVGDSGSGGTKGLVVAPATGDAAASKFLKADGTWAVVSGGGVVTDSGAAILSNKTLIDNSTFIVYVSDNTVRFGFDLSGGTTGTTTTFKTVQSVNRSLTFPDITDFLVSRNSSDTLTNKLLKVDTVKFIDPSNATVQIKFDTSAQASLTTLTLASLISTSRSVFIPDNAANYILLGDRVPNQVITNKDIDGGTASNTSRITLPKDSKTNLDSLTRKQATIVYASDQNKAYVDNGVSLIPVGSGSGGGINFISLDSTFASTQSDSVDAENSVGNWAAYADAAGPVPVDMTGGSPVTTITRTTTVGEVLDGTASFKITKDAANRQGEGASVIGYIPLGYRGKRASILFPFKIISGSLVQGDLKLYAYDVTNSQVLTPSHNDVIFSSTLRAAVDIPATCVEIRFGFHFASTSTTAVTFSFDDVTVSTQDISLTSVVTDWTPYSLVIGATTTPPTLAGVTRNDAKWRRVGDSMEIMYSFEQTSGSSAGSGTYLFPLPTGYQVDLIKLPAQTSFETAMVGPGVVGNDPGVGPTNKYGYMQVWDANNLNMTYYDLGASVNGQLRQVGTSSFGLAGTSYLSFTARVPISNWSSNTTVANTGILYMSQVLASGTRVTTTPTLLGQYRTQLRNASDVTYTDVNGAPSIATTPADGMHIWGGNGFAGADTNNNPSKWVIFVGINKSINVQFFNATGKTDPVSVDITNAATTNALYGEYVNYERSTGLLTINHPTFGVESIDYVGRTASFGNVSDAYFEVIVADNDFQIQLQSTPNVVVSASTGTGVTTSSATYVDITGLTNIINCNGRPVRIGMQPDGVNGSQTAQSTDGSVLQIQLLRDGTSIGAWTCNTAGGRTDYSVSGFNMIDASPLPGTHTYQWQFQINTGTATMLGAVSVAVQL